MSTPKRLLDMIATEVFEEREAVRLEEKRERNPRIDPMPEDESDKQIAPFMKPSMKLLCTLGSIVVHADEALSSDGHQFDLIALRGLLADPELNEWLDGMRKAAFLPIKRKG